MQVLAAALVDKKSIPTPADDGESDGEEDAPMEQEGTPKHSDSVVSDPGGATVGAAGGTPPGDSASSSAPTPSSAAAAASPSPSTSSHQPPAAPNPPDLSRVGELLRYYRELSDHVVREYTQGWEHAGFGGVLTTEWQPKSPRPISLVWLHDEEASDARNDNQELATHLKSMPLLPHWMIGSEHDGNGDDLMRALILADANGPQRLLTGNKPIWDIKAELSRDPLYGMVQANDKDKEDYGLAHYREMYVPSHALQAAQPSSAALISVCFVLLCLFLFKHVQMEGISSVPDDRDVHFSAGTNRHAQVHAGAG